MSKWSSKILKVCTGNCSSRNSINHSMCDDIRDMKFDLEERLVKFGVMVIKLIEKLLADKACQHLGGQLLRSGTAPALLYGEAQCAESRKDFIHKMKIGLKELRETNVCLQIIGSLGISSLSEPIDNTTKENRELIAIFHKSIATAQQNLNKKSD